MIDSASTIRELVKYRKCDLYSVEARTKRSTLDTAEETARDVSGHGHGFAVGPLPYGYRSVLVNPHVVDRKKSKKRIEIVESDALK